MITVREIYDAIDQEIPFFAAEKWDNCGILAGNPDGSVTKILTCLDITSDVISEAVKVGAELIVSHHPIIFMPLKSVYSNSTVGMLLKNDISAICTHTPFDIAPCGMSNGLYEILSKPLGLCGTPQPLDDETGIGRIYDLSTNMYADEMAQILKKSLGCTVVRYTKSDKAIKKIAVSSGSGNSFWETAQQKGADALVSGDFKHDVLTDAKNSGFILFDCGHYHTERIFGNMMRKILSEKFPEISVCTAENLTDPVDYCID